MGGKKREEIFEEKIGFRLFDRRKEWKKEKK